MSGLNIIRYRKDFLYENGHPKNFIKGDEHCCDKCMEEFIKNDYKYEILLDISYDNYIPDKVIGK